MSKILDFVSAALSDQSNSYAEFDLGIVPPFQGQEIASKTGIVTIAGAKKTITAHAVRHAFVRHTAKKSEADRGQEAITEADFEFLANIISSPTSIEKGDTQNRKNNDVLKFGKQIRGRKYYVLMSISRSKDRTQLFFNTMFIKK